MQKINSTSLNRIPDKIKKIYMIAICGTGMGAVACMLKDLGYEVTGSDQKVYPPMSNFLLQKGIAAFDGFNAKNISSGYDLIIVGNAVSRDNPEVEKMLELGLDFCSMPQAVNRFIAKNKKQIVITGTHGKTTTSSILAWLLYKANLDPSFLIGGILQNFRSNYRIGKGTYIIIEGDEYDTAFFDKGPKFLHYDPYIAVLTGIEFDHADIFKDINHVKKTFDNFISGIHSSHTLLAYDGDKNVLKLLDGKKCRVEKYGKNHFSRWRLSNITTNLPWTSFEVLKNNKLLGTFKTRLVGEHNLLNSLAVVAIADKIHIPVRVIAKAFETFQGVKRRQEVIGQKKGVTVMDDFAHHPTAVRETIKGVKRFCQAGRIIAVFEPRTNSSMRNVFQTIYPLSFDEADLICIRRPPLLEKIPLNERFSSEKLVNDLNLRGKDAYYFSDTEPVIDFLVKEAKPGDLILIMSNGGFDNIHKKLLESL